MKPIYTNDHNAPRVNKGKFSCSVVSKELWKEFQKEYGKIPWSEFYTMWQDIAETIRVEAIENPLGVKLGSYMGELKFQYLPHNFESIDHKATNELGEEATNLNLTARGKQGKLKWERRWAVKFNKMLQFYAFEPTRKMEKAANIYAQENPEKLRVARNTLGGFSIWRQLKNYGK